MKIELDKLETELTILTDKVVEARNTCNEALKMIEEFRRRLNKEQLKQSENVK